MARIVLAPLVTDIRGKLGDLVFSSWKAGVNYVRSITGVIKNPSSYDQVLQRQRVSVASKYWNVTLTAAQRAEWDTWALTQPGKGPSDGGVNHMIKGNSGNLSGFNAFLMSNGWLSSVHLVQADDAPLAAVAPGIPTNVAVVCVAGTATVTWNTPIPAIALSLCRIWGRIEGIKGHVQLISFEAYDANTKDITAIKGANGSSLLFTSLVGKRLWIQMDTVSPDGTKSAGSISTSVVIA
ncbi:unnamed protein product [marine sediment metagenome]|uniref:Uncharacterized protein n=1 Tax=marine sediment metagenome TaxID=412755 RepID=X1M4I8_9ZZZZ